MANPVEGSDFTVEMESPETLVGATVTVEYRTPNRQLTVDVAPTSVDTVNDIVYYEIPKEDAMQGKWRLWAKIVNAAGKATYSNPPVEVFFDRK
jgi:hypothetical protein